MPSLSEVIPDFDLPVTMKAHDLAPVLLRLARSPRRHGKELEVENFQLPRSEAEGTVQAAADFTKLYAVVADPAASFWRPNRNRSMAI